MQGQKENSDTTENVLCLDGTKAFDAIIVLAEENRMANRKAGMAVLVLLRLPASIGV